MKFEALSIRHVKNFSNVKSVNRMRSTKIPSEIGKYR